MAKFKKFKADDLENVTPQEEQTMIAQVENVVVQPTISFDAYFNVLCTKSKGKIKLHHKEPMKKFLERFGNANAQSTEWFDTHVARY